MIQIPVHYFVWSTPHSKRWYQKELANKAKCLSQNGREIVFKWKTVKTKAPKRFELGSFKRPILNKKHHSQKVHLQERVWEVRTVLS